MTQLMPYIMDLARAMVFVDGENLAIRYGNMLKTLNEQPKPHVLYEPNVFVWSPRLNGPTPGASIIRRYYYTAVQGDNARIDNITAQLRLPYLRRRGCFGRTSPKARSV